MLSSLLLCTLSQIFHLLSVFMQLHSKSLNSPLKLIDRQTFRFSLLLLAFSSFLAYFALQYLSILNFVNYEIITIIIVIILAHTSLEASFPESLLKYAKILVIGILLFLILSYFDSNINLSHIGQSKISNESVNSINTTHIINFEKDFKNEINQIFFPDEIQILIKVIIIFFIILFDLLSTRKIQRKNTRKFIFLSFGLAISYLTFTFKTLTTTSLNEETNLFSQKFVRFILEFIIAFAIYAYELTKILYFHDSSELVTNGFITFHILMIILSVFNRFYLSYQFHKSIDASQNSNHSKKIVSLLSKISFYSSKSTFSIFGFFILITSFVQIASINLLFKKSKSLMAHREQLIDANNLSHELFQL